MSLRIRARSQVDDTLLLFNNVKEFQELFKNGPSCS